MHRRFEGRGVSDIVKLIEELKRALKAAGKTYADLAQALDVSEPAIKRTFSERSFSLDRFAAAAAFAGVTMQELCERAETRAPTISKLSIQQEEELFGDIKLLLIANLVLNRWKFGEILEIFEFGENELVRFFVRLDRMRMIELLPGNEYRLLVSRNFSWRARGPVQKFFNQYVQSAFFDSLFDQTGEKLIFSSGMLSRGNFARFHTGMEKLAQEFDQWVREDSTLPLCERFTCSLVLAIRPWTFPPFARYRRTPSSKKL
jgi:transcriptional regulator with XRE-family HTH domain